MGLVLLLPPLALLLVLGAGRLGWLAGTPPDDLGISQGQLKPPSATPNSVTSQADRWPGHPQRESAAIAPLAARGSGPQTIARLAELVRRTPGAQVVTLREDYLRATFATRWLGFVDDAEFWWDPAAGVVQLRSASRLGRRDFGANRARIEALRAQLAAG